MIKKINIDDVFEFADENAIRWIGFDDAIVGTDTSGKLVYNINKMIHILVENDNMTEEDAIEYLEFNVLNTYVGEMTPVHVYVRV